MKKFMNFYHRFTVYLSIIISVSALVFIVGFILVNGVPLLSLDYFTSTDYRYGGSIIPMIITTIELIFIVLLVSVPIGVCTGIYLTEYAKKGSRFVKLVSLSTECLAGIPSIIFGLFGFIFFVMLLGFQWSLLAGALTCSIIVLPTIIRSTEEAVKAVPQMYREGSYALGAGRLRTIVKIILPQCLPGILSAVILSIGRIAGETAAVYLTAGTVIRIPTSLGHSGRTLSVHMYLLAKEGMEFDKIYSTVIVLLAVVLLLNLAANFIGRKNSKG